jgi:fumarylacetoacetase
MLFFLYLCGSKILIYMTTWLSIPKNSDFSIHNIPFGVGRDTEGDVRIYTRIGDQVADLQIMANLAFFDDILADRNIFQQGSLNPFIALGKEVTSAVRMCLQKCFSEDFMSSKTLSEFYLFPADSVEMLLPIQIGDYTDFYSSKEHATNVGIMFRDPANALLPNWLHLPVGYHGRSSSIVVSGTPLRRPKGQVLPPDVGNNPIFSESKRVDFELEMAFVIGKETKLGDSIDIKDAEQYIFGMMLFNDWSARDIQQWEYVPLGPFLGKNFGSTLSPWIVTMEALEPFRMQGPTQDPAPMPYLQYEGAKSYDINLQVAIKPSDAEATTVCNSNFKYMYWNMIQQLTHHTVNGCNVRVGDLMASGTISGPTPDSYGSMLELAWKGTKPITLSNGSERRFIQDGDTVQMRAWCKNQDFRIGFGDCDGMILASNV